MCMYPDRFKNLHSNRSQAFENPTISTDTGLKTEHFILEAIGTLKRWCNGGVEIVASLSGLTIITQVPGEKTDPSTICSMAN